ncbi:MAG: hypothetical protein JXC85_00515 [Candidatus Aenigmarchaeota archaeon]|nr:hypothetical protein [Candidatus Aenigmarchaeota archaeon]
MDEGGRDDLRKQLIGLFSAYAKDPTDFAMKKRARLLHTACGNSGQEVDRMMRHAISLLVNIGWDLPLPPKPSREEAEKLVYALAARKP